ncbi:MAG: hypothetical protein AB8F34_13125 [Akkermansiaceae bacterium]
MKNPHSRTGRGFALAGNARGLTLPELTLTISILLTLVGLLFTGSSIYASHANRSSCVMAQDQIRKAIVANANMKGQTMRPGVDYYAQAVDSGVLDIPITCPESGGNYTATVDRVGGQLKITCADHGDDHRHE